MSDENVFSSAPAGDCWASKSAESPCATEKPAAAYNSSTGRSQRFASFGALLSAFIASSWCWLPPLLILGGISGAGMTSVMQEYRPLLLAVTFAFLGLAFYLTYRPRPTATTSVDNSDQSVAIGSQRRSHIMVMNKVILWAVTAIAIVFLFFPQAFPSYFDSNDSFTADMDRTVLTIEGMTWHTWVPRAEKALESTPGVLAVKVDFETGQAIVGTNAGSRVPAEKILAALKAVGYRGEIVEHASRRATHEGKPGT